MAFLSAIPVSSTNRRHHLANTCRRPVRTLVASAAPPSEKQQSEKPQIKKEDTSAPPPRLSNAQVVLERLGDTLLDARIHYTRLFSPYKPQNSTGGLRVVILGTGWGAHSLVKVIDTTAIESVTVISPRNFFFFTPLLSATAVGTIEFRSIVEPIRKANPYVSYFEASATDIDLENKVIHCIRASRSSSDIRPVDVSSPDLQFEVPYDVLVIGVGEQTATFNVPGARENAYFLKEISDARKLRSNLLGSSYYFFFFFCHMSVLFYLTEQLIN